MVDYKELLDMLLNTPKGQRFKDDPRFKLKGDENENMLKNKYIMLQDIIRQGLDPISSYMSEIINEVLTQKLEEKLCPRGQAYVAQRKKPKSKGGGGEKHSAYLIGRGVKVCKGQIKKKK